MTKALENQRNPRDNDCILRLPLLERSFEKNPCTEQEKKRLEVWVPIEWLLLLVVPVFVTITRMTINPFMQRIDKQTGLTEPHTIWYENEKSVLFQIFLLENAGPVISSQCSRVLKGISRIRTDRSGDTLISWQSLWRCSCRDYYCSRLHRMQSMTWWDNGLFLHFLIQYFSTRTEFPGNEIFFERANVRTSLESQKMTSRLWEPLSDSVVSSSKWLERKWKYRLQI